MASDFSPDYELAGLLAKHFGGALPFERLEGMTRREMMWYYRRYERQAVEDEIRNEYLYPASGKPKALPSPARMRELVEARIRKYHGQTEDGK